MATRHRDAPRDAAEPTPQPEREEPPLDDPGLTDLSTRDYLAALQRAAKEAMADNITNLAAALAYYGFLTIPSLLLVAVGVFGLVADPSSVQTIVDKVGSVAPAEATTLVEDSLNRMVQQQSGASIVIVVVGLLFALWSLTGAMQTVQWALNMAYGREETRGFAKRRLIALAMIAALGLAFLLVFALLVLGPALSRWVGDALGAGSFFDWIWWTAQWPVLVIGLLLAFAVVLYLGPNLEQRHWSFLTPGSAIAVVIWLLASGAFALYVGSFGSYNKAWGSLAAVVIMLTWLWLSALALLFAAELNAELDRSRRLRQRRA